jgi:hypothetical protein
VIGTCSNEQKSRAPEAKAPAAWLPCGNTVNKKLMPIPPNFDRPQLEINVLPLKQLAEKQTLAGFP